MERDEYDSFLFKDLKMALDIDVLNYERDDDHLDNLLSTGSNMDELKVLTKKENKDLKYYYKLENEFKTADIKGDIIQNKFDIQNQPTKDKKTNKLKRYSKGMLPLPKTRHFFYNKIQPNEIYSNQKKLLLKKEVIKQTQDELDNKEELSLNNSNKLRHKTGSINKQQASIRRIINKPELKNQILNTKKIFDKVQVDDIDITELLNKENTMNKKLPRKVPFQLPDPIKRNLKMPNTPKLRHLKISEKEEEQEEEQVSKSILLKYIINNKPPYETMSSDLNFLNLSPTLPPSKLTDNNNISKEEDNCSLYDQVSLDYLKFQTECKNQFALNRLDQSLSILNNTNPINQKALNKKLEELKSLLLSMKCCCNCC